MLTAYENWAVVGWSPDPRRDSHEIAAFLERIGKRVWRVNPNAPGAYPSLAAIGEPVEVVDVFRRSALAGAHVDEAIAIGAKAVWMQLGVVDHDAAGRAREPPGSTSSWTAARPSSGTPAVARHSPRRPAPGTPELRPLPSRIRVRPLTTDSRLLGDDVRARARLVVAALDQQPLRLLARPVRCSANPPRSFSPCRTNTAWPRSIASGHGTRPPCS